MDCLATGFRVARSVTKARDPREKPRLSPGPRRNSVEPTEKVRAVTRPCAEASPKAPWYSVADMRDAKAFWVVGRERGEVRAETLAEPRDGEVLVEALYTGVSRGTELNVFRGKVPPSCFSRS